MRKLNISEPSTRESGPILICDEGHNDVAEFFHNGHATVSQSYETALEYARCLVVRSEAFECLQSIADMKDDDPREPDDADWRYRALEAKRAAQRAIAALSTPPAGGGVRVKPLEWSGRSSNGKIHKAYVVPMEYWAWESAGFGYWSWGSLSGREVYGGLDGAKAAAQSDFEQRIRSAITATVRTAEPGYVADRETIAEAMWRGELRRAAGKERNIPWSEVSETDQARWLYLADAAIAALPAPTTASAGWQPIETAPKDGTGFIFYQPVVGGRRIIDSGYFDGELFRAVDFYGVDDPVVNPTHWMPLPAAPTKRSAT